MVVEDCVVEGLIPFAQAGVAVGDSELSKWPEEVRYTSYPIEVTSQVAGTIVSLGEMLVDGTPISSRVVGQSFGIPLEDGDQFLEKILITAKVNPVKGSSYSARLVDLGDSPDREGYDAGNSLLPGDTTFEINTPASREKGAGRIMSFTFTGAERVRLKAGHSYSFELVANPENKAAAVLSWFRSGQRAMATAPLPDATAFCVPTAEGTTKDDRRSPLKDRQCYIGIKTSPAK